MNRIKALLSVTLLFVIALSGVAGATVDQTHTAERAPSCSVRPDRPWCR